MLLNPNENMGSSQVLFQICLDGEDWAYLFIPVQQEYGFIGLQKIQRIQMCISNNMYSQCSQVLLKRLTKFNSAHMAVCMSVTSRCSTKMAKHRNTQTMPRDSPGTLVF